MNTRDTGPRVPGGRYLSGYWQAEYTVESMASLVDGGYPVFTVRWTDGRRTTHMTPWDARADRVLA
jgi:hypothetical protein